MSEMDREHSAATTKAEGHKAAMEMDQNGQVEAEDQPAKPGLLREYKQ